jgi:hypothetical protein
VIVNPTQKPNSTPVAKHFATSAPLEEKLMLPGLPARDRIRPMHRLSVGVITPKESVTIQKLWEHIVHGPMRCRFVFPDTGFVTTRVHEQFWNLGADKRFLFAEMTAAELSGWIANPIHNAYLHTWLPRGLEACRNSSDRNGPIRQASVLGTDCNQLVPYNIGLIEKADILDCGYQHYVDLLSLRKRLGIREAGEFAAEHGREPESQDLRNRLSRKYHQRVVPIAMEGWEKAGARNYTADEELVVSAVTTAIMTGEPVLILTRDTDVFDQFMKLFEMMLGDYSAFRFAEVLAAQGDDMPMQRIPVDRSNDFGFTGDSIDCIVISSADAERLPPTRHTPVHCFCALVGNHCDDPKVSIAGYCLETEMQSLLRVKYDTSGKNTKRLDDNDVTIGMHHKDGKLGVMYAVGKQRPLEYEGVITTQVNLIHVLKDDPMIVRRNVLW